MNQRTTTGAGQCFGGGKIDDRVIGIIRVYVYPSPITNSLITK